MCIIRKKQKHPSIYSMPYHQRVQNYNYEKQSALTLASTPGEADRIIRYLRRKWGI